MRAFMVENLQEVSSEGYKLLESFIQRCNRREWEFVAWPCFELVSRVPLPERGVFCIPSPSECPKPLDPKPNLDRACHDQVQRRPQAANAMGSGAQDILDNMFSKKPTRVHPQVRAVLWVRYTYN